MTFTVTDNQIRMEFEDAQAFMYGHFVLASGKHSDTYIQCAKLMFNTERSSKVLGWLAEKIIEEEGIDSINEIDVVISPAIGGVIAGYEVARCLKKNFAFFERVNKKFQLRRGFEIKKGSKVIIIEDVLTTGGSCVEIMEFLKEFSVKTVVVASLIDRSNGIAQKNLDTKVISLLNMNLKTYEEGELPNELKAIPRKILGTKAITKNDKMEDII